MLVVVYVVLAVIVGLAGRRRTFGFAGYVLLALVFTPIPPLLFLLLTQKRFLESENRKKIGASRYCPACGCDLYDAAGRHRCDRCGAAA